MRAGAPNADREPLTPAVLRWSALGSAVGVGLVVIGHYNDAVYGVWPLPLVFASAVAASAYVIQVRRSAGDSVWHGGMVGGICGFGATALAAVMADVPAADLATVTLSATGAGAVVGWLTYLLLHRFCRSGDG